MFIVARFLSNKQRPSSAREDTLPDRISWVSPAVNYCFAHETWNHASDRGRNAHHCQNGLLPLRVARPKNARIAPQARFFPLCFVHRAGPRASEGPTDEKSWQPIGLCLRRRATPRLHNQRALFCYNTLKSFSRIEETTRRTKQGIRKLPRLGGRGKSGIARDRTLRYPILPNAGVNSYRVLALTDRDFVPGRMTTSRSAAAN
jgi:hypothetical protein